MLQISTFLKEIGFSLKIQSDGSFNGYYISDNCIELNVIYFDSIIGIQAEFNSLTKTIIDSTKIMSVNELIYILSRNVFIETQFQTLHREMIQSQTLSNVKHP